jgi:hypothetical protein
VALDTVSPQFRVAGSMFGRLNVFFYALL